MTRTAGEGKVMATTRAEAIGEAIRWRIPKVDNSITAVSPFWEAARSCARKTEGKKENEVLGGIENQRRNRTRKKICVV